MRYDHLRLSFVQTKAEDDDTLRHHLNEVYVPNHAARNLRDTDKYIFIGRKGSGKSALIMNHTNRHGERYDHIIRIIKDHEPSWILYNFFFKKFRRAFETTQNRFPTQGLRDKDIGDVLDTQHLFAIAWAAAIQICLIDYLVHNSKILQIDNSDNNLQKLREYLTVQFSVDSSKPGTWFTKEMLDSLPAIFDMIQNIIEKMLNVDVPSMGVLLSRLSSIFFGNLTETIIPPPVNQALVDLLNKTNIKVLITMDNYDDFIDGITSDLDDLTIKKHKISPTPEIDDLLFQRSSMLTFQRNMLRGLLLATKRLRGAGGYHNVRYAFAIPRDRFDELHLRELAEFRQRYLDHIKWTPLELIEFIVRRCALAMKYRVEIREVDDLKTHYKILMERLNWPRLMPHKVVTEAKEDTLLYLIRHSLWRPRDLQRYFYLLFSEMEEKTANKNQLTDSEKIDLLRAVVRNRSKHIVADDFLEEYRAEYPLLKEVIGKFREGSNVLDGDRLRESVGKESLTFLYSMSPDEIVARLYNIGFLGKRNTNPGNKPGQMKQNRQDVYYEFVYRNGMEEIFDHSSVGNLDRQQWVIHPMFYQYLDIQTAREFVVQEMSWDSVVAEYGPLYHPVRCG